VCVVRLPLTFVRGTSVRSPEPAEGHVTGYKLQVAPRGVYPEPFDFAQDKLRRRARDHLAISNRMPSGRLRIIGALDWPLAELAALPRTFRPRSPRR
jgi:hypothetical protein